MVWYSRKAMHKKFTYDDALQGLYRCCPTHFGAFPGGMNPIFKNKDKWWESPAFNIVAEPPEAVAAVGKIMEEMGEIAAKHAPGIAKKYEN